MAAGAVKSMSTCGVGFRSYVIGVPIVLKQLVDSLNPELAPLTIPALLLMAYGALRLASTLFQELRRGTTADGKTKVKTPQGVLSTAEAISVLFNGGILAQSFGSGAVTGDEVARSLVGALAKEGKDDLKVLREYVETVAKSRPGPWKTFYQAARKSLPT